MTGVPVTHHPRCKPDRCEGDCWTVMSRRSFLIGAGAAVALAATGLGMGPSEPELAAVANDLLGFPAQSDGLTYNGTPFVTSKIARRNHFYVVSVDSTYGKESITFSQPLDYDNVVYRIKS